MKFRQLMDRNSIRIRVTGVEMAALRKIVALGLRALEEIDDAKNPLTTSERKAQAYWKGNPFKGWPAKKPRRRAAPRSGTPAKPQPGGKPTPAAQSRPRAPKADLSPVT